MQSRIHLPFWLWALFALSLSFVLVLAGFAIDSGWQLHRAGQRIADLNRLQSLLLNERSNFGKANGIADRYAQTGSSIEGDGLRDYVRAVAAAREGMSQLRTRAGNNTREAAVVHHLAVNLDASLAAFQRGINLRKAGAADAAVRAYRGSDLLRLTVYSGLDALAAFSAQDEQSLAATVSARGRHTSRLAWMGGLLAVLLLSIYAALLLLYLRRAEAEDRYRRLFQYATDPVILLHSGGKILAANLAWQHLTGIAADAPLPSVLDFTAPASLPLVATILAGEPVHARQLEVVNATGERLILEVSSSLIRHEGRENLIQVIARDVTARVEMDRLKDEFISVVSHELRTPLTSIRGALGLLATGKLGELPGQGQKILGVASHNAERLVCLVNDILDLERLQSGKLSMELRDVEAQQLATAAIESMLGMALKNAVELDCDAEPFTLRADPDRLQQVLTNLLGNAIKFSPEGGTVLLRARQMDGEAEFRVIDNGRGIPTPMLEPIFERFQQVDSSDTRKQGGTGLGLPICRSIVEQHHGRIWAESELGHGSTFIVRLPLTPESDRGNLEVPRAERASIADNRSRDCGDQRTGAPTNFVRGVGER